MVKPKRFVILTLIVTLSLLWRDDTSESSLYGPDAFDFTAIDTHTTLEARHLIVGEVIDVSFVADYGWEIDPLSLVTVRVDCDMKKDNQETAPPERRASSESPKTPTVTFLQTGGTYSDGGRVTVASVRTLRRGESVFLRLVPSFKSFEHHGQMIETRTLDVATVYTVEQEGDNLEQHIIKRGWQGLDVTVLQMARIVRATLKRPRRMWTFERCVNGLKYPRRKPWQKRDALMSPDPRLAIVMGEVAAIEAALNLSTISLQQD